MAQPWRLLLDGPASGAWNMAVDEALLHSARRGGTPTLRLYRWRGPWLSLGYAQKFPAARAQACAAAGVGVVRRVSGGRAVLHGRDLTYAVAAPAELLPAGLTASYRLLSAAILAALRSLGVEAVRAAAEARVPAAADFDCFAASAPEEISVGGRKLAGSAQRRSECAVLQHGSIRLEPDPPQAVFASGLGPGATSLAELGAPDPHGRRLRRALAQALARALGADLEASRLGPGERRAACAGARRLRRDPLRARFPTRISVSRAPGDGRYD